MGDVLGRDSSSDHLLVPCSVVCLMRFQSDEFPSHTVDPTSTFYETYFQIPPPMYDTINRTTHRQLTEVRAFCPIGWVAAYQPFTPWTKANFWRNKNQRQTQPVTLSALGSCHIIPLFLWYRMNLKHFCTMTDRLWIYRQGHSSKGTMLISAPMYKIYCKYL